MQGVRVQSLVGKLRSCALCRYRLTNQLLALPTLPSLPKHPFLSTCWWHKYWPHCCSSSSHRTQQSLSWKEDTWAHSPRVCGGVCVCVCVCMQTRSWDHCCLHLTDQETAQRFAPGHTCSKNCTQGANLASALTLCARTWPKTWSPQVQGLQGNAPGVGKTRAAASMEENKPR